MVQKKKNIFSKVLQKLDKACTQIVHRRMKRKIKRRRTKGQCPRVIAAERTKTKVVKLFKKK